MAEVMMWKRYHKIRILCVLVWLSYFSYVCGSCLLQVCGCVLSLTVATILLTAAADSSSPLGCSTIVTPRYLSWNTMPSRRVSLVSVQFSGSSADEKHTSDTFAHQQPPQLVLWDRLRDTLSDMSQYSTAFFQSTRHSSFGCDSSQTMSSLWVCGMSTWF